MKRSFSIITAALQARSTAMFSTSEKHNLVANFKDWKFHSPPSYCDLPIDMNNVHNVPTAVFNVIFSKVPPEPVEDLMRLVCSSDEALSEILDLEPDVAYTDQFLDFVAGKNMPEGAVTVCHRYGGYQFGYWADQLGDGRAHLLGEYINSKKEMWQLQTKGSGETPYSRFGDGRAVLRSSVREMVASEACHWLGIPTTRAAAIIASDKPLVPRDKKYSGFVRLERAAVVLRLAPGWYRFGSLEILCKKKEMELLKTLCDFIIKVHFPEISGDNKYVKWFQEVSRRTLDMVATWQGFGFTHGVLNTDNMSILGLTIDYGPYGFLDQFSEHYVPNGSDDWGRYSYGKQPEIVLWNIVKLSKAIEPILSDQQKLQIPELIEGFKPYVDGKILNIFRVKLGLKLIQDGDRSLVSDLLNIMENAGADFTCTFRQLAQVDCKDLLKKEVINKQWSLNKLMESRGWEKWVERYTSRVAEETMDESERRELMCSVNPVYVPRNWMLQEAIKDAEKKKFDKVRFLLKILKTPYVVNAGAEALGYSAQPPSWSLGLKLSCSS